MLKKKYRYLNQQQKYNMLLLRSHNINRYIQYKKNEMKSVSEIVKNYNITDDDNSEKIGLYSLHLLINNIKNDFNEEVQVVQGKSSTNIFHKDRILVIISCHTNNRLRLKSIQLIMHFLKEVENIDIIIVNSKGLPISGFVKEHYKNDYFKYYEINNDQYYGFSKWYYGLIQNDFMKYKFITFMNDSILINQSIKHFFDYTRYKNVDLYGYNDSSQLTHHYQSYFFSVKNTAIVHFLRLFEDNKRFVRSYNDAVHYLELRMFQYFSNRDCFLKIGHFPFNHSKNIFIQNDFLYFKLRQYGLLPFTKLKRISNNV